VRRLGQGIVGLFQPNVLARTEYDEFMLRLHHFLKTNDEIPGMRDAQALALQAGTAWLLFSDTSAMRNCAPACAGAFVLRGAATLALPNESPPARLERMCQAGVLPKAA